MAVAGEGAFGKVVRPSDQVWKDYNVYYVTTERGARCADELESNLPQALGCVSGEYRNESDVIIKMLNPADTILPRELVGAMYVMSCVGDDPERLSILARQTMHDGRSTTAMWCLKKVVMQKKNESKYGLVFRRMDGDVLDMNIYNMRVDPDLDWGLSKNAAIVPRTLAMVELLQRHEYVHGDIKPENIMYVDDVNGNREFALGDYGSVTKWSVYSHDNYGIFTSTFVSPLYRQGIKAPLHLWAFVGCEETWKTLAGRVVAYTSCWWTWDLHSTGASIADYLCRSSEYRVEHSLEGVPPLTEPLLRAARVLLSGGKGWGKDPLSPTADRMAVLRAICPELPWHQPPTVPARPQQQQQQQQHQGVAAHERDEPPRPQEGVITAARAADVIADKMKLMGFPLERHEQWRARRNPAVAPAPAPDAPPMRKEAWGANRGKVPAHANVVLLPAAAARQRVPEYIQQQQRHDIAELLGRHGQYFGKFRIASAPRGGGRPTFGTLPIEELIESDDEEEDEDEDDEIKIDETHSELLEKRNEIINIDDAEAVAEANDDHEFELAAFAMRLMSQPGSTLGSDYWNMVAEYFALRVSTSLVFDGVPVSDDSKAAFAAVSEMHTSIHAHLFDRHSPPGGGGGARPRARAVRAQSKTPTPKQRTTRSATAKAAATKATAATKAKAAAKSTGRPNGRKPPAATRRGGA
jgi:hypothetical protein